MSVLRWTSPGARLALVVGLAAALRLPGLATDFWLDEIWTLKIVLGLDSVLDVFTEVRHSNNHHLNTLLFYAFGDLERWWIYRLPALLAGIASVGLAFRLGSRESSAEGVVAGVLCATSYLLVHFSSEARGYSLVLFFALATFALLRDFPDRRRPIGLASCAVLGFLSHLMYLHVFLAAGVWMAVRLLRREVGLQRAASGWLRLFAVPAVFLVAFYWLDVRLTKIGEGPPTDAAEVFLRALSYAVGGPPWGAGAGLAALATLLIFGGAIAWWWRAGRDEWLFLAGVVFVSPAVTYLALQPEIFFVRYFLLSVLFGLLALAAPLARGLERGGGWRVAAAGLLAAMVVGNAVNLARFYRYGRGDYLATVRVIADAATSRLPTVSSDHRFRNRNVIRFYNRYLPPDRRLVYQDQSDFPDWLLFHRFGRIGPVERVIARDEHRYVLERVAPYADLSGWHWLLYRKVR